ncbi:DUF2184 domain-containing protein [Asticcacaulis endophyticus]|uniref:DUF2184 domain-containing protein n=1 Tax=Asticcacaulis endophyticus TaxID=1395890 RepID=UPI001E51AC61|nr:DUF2184 domain-containing protein [Asticcacaulis endophyticus]
MTPAFYNIERTVYQKKYPSFDYASVIPVITEGSEWARGTLFRSSDAAGKAEFLSGKGFDMPYADVTRDQFLKAFELAGIGYEWSLEEINVAAAEGRQLGDEKGQGARRIAEQFLWGVAMTGTGEKGWTGLVNDTNVTATTAPADGTGSATTWASKTPTQVLRDFNALITNQYLGTAETAMADTVLLPWGVLNYMATTPIGDNADKTILTFLRENNAYTGETGLPLVIRSLRALNTAGASSSGRAVAYRRDPEVLRFHLPMPHKFLAPWQKGSMTYEVAGIMRTGGTEIRLPKEVRYLDGIS